MSAATILLLCMYGYATYKSIRYYLSNTDMPSPRKVMVGNIILACVVYLCVFTLNLFGDDFRYAWQGVGLINSLTFIHIINIFKENPVSGRDNQEGT